MGDPGSRQLLVNGRLYTSGGVIVDGSVLIDGEGKIEAIGGPDVTPADVPILDLKGNLVLPGFIDVHVHGGLGHDVMDRTYEGLDGMSRFHAAHGTTSFLATTDAASDSELLKAVRNIAEGCERGLNGAELLGVHLEGPYLNPIRAGAQNKSHIRPVELKELRRYIDGSGGRVRLVTMAPELEGGLEAVRWLRQAGITVSIGHSDASFAQALEAVRSGCTHTTHHFNGMSPFHHREPGLAGAGLMLNELTTELIADGIHVHPAAVKLLFETKGVRSVCLITDAVSCAGLPDGEYGHTTMKDGQIWLKDGSSLAGSSLTMLKALKNALAYTGYPLERLLPSLTEVPARQIGVSDRKGSLEAGKDADLLIMDKELNLLSTIVRGREVYARG